jgi:outer membrane protein TolC
MRFIALSSILLAAATNAFAATPPKESPLAALLREALARNPDILAAEAACAAARARVTTRRAISDPMIALGWTNDGWSPSLGREPMSTLGVMASLALPFPGKRALAGRIALREAELFEQQLARTRLRVAADVQREYYGLLLAREQRSLAEAQRAAWDEIEALVRARYTVGQGTQGDVLRAQIERTRSEQGATSAATEIEIRAGEMNRLLARDSDTPFDTTETLALRRLERSADEILAGVRAASPELQAGQIAVERERLALALAQKAALPDITLQAGYMNRGALAPMWQAGVGLALPLNRKSRASAVAEAQSLVTAAERVREALDLRLRLRTQERIARIRSLEKIIVLYEEGLLPQGQLAVETLLASYQSGQASLGGVIEARTALYRDQAEAARLIAEHARLMASLREASLTDSPEMPSAAAAETWGMARGGTAPRAGMKD